MYTVQSRKVKREKELNNKCVFQPGRARNLDLSLNFQEIETTVIAKTKILNLQNFSSSVNLLKCVIFHVAEKVRPTYSLFIKKLVTLEN